MLQAYEILSDDALRRDYDRNGRSSSTSSSRSNQQNNNQQNNNNFGNSWFWNFNFHGRQQQQQHGTRKGHRFLYDYQMRIQIKDAQSRCLTITGLTHLQFITLDEHEKTDR